jgi:O-antigen/teichoic acid export membrane protein
MQQRSFFNALKWAYAGNIGDRAISALVTFVLAGILGPRDFGIISIGLIYIIFMQMFLDQGLASALIQKKELKQEHCDAVFWMNLTIGFIMVIVTIFVSGWWARINHAPDLARVLSVLSLCLPIEGLSIVQAAVVRREMDFRSLTIRSNVSALVGGVVGLGMAFAGFGVWSLVGQQLSRDLSALILLWKLSHWRPRMEFSWPHLKELLGFSVHSFVGGLGIFADLQASSILLGLLFGPVAVGLYRLADRLMGSVVSMATTSIQGVSFPEFSRYQDQPEQLRKSTLACVRLSSIVTIPALVGMAMVSAPLLATLGPKWVPATNVLRILCIQGMVFALSYFTGPLLTAIGKPQLNAKLEWARAIVGVLFILVTGFLLRNAEVSWQVSGIALARAIPNIFLITPVFLFLLLHFTGVSFKDLILAILNPILAGAAIIVVILFFNLSGFLSDSKPLAMLVLETSLGGIAGLTTLLAIDKDIRGLAKGILGKVPWFSHAE